MLIFETGIYSEVSESKMYTLTQRIYAHRKYSRLLVVEVDITRTDTTPLKLKVKLNKWTASYDITFLKHDSMIDEVRWVTTVFRCNWIMSYWL